MILVLILLIMLVNLFEKYLNKTDFKDLRNQKKKTFESKVCLTVQNLKGKLVI